MQVDAGQQVHDIGAFVQRDPVELHVLPGGEVGIAPGQRRRGDAANFVLCGLCLVKQGLVGLVVVARNLGQDTDLVCRDLAIRHSHPQHGGVALNIPAVLQAQGSELVIAERARKVALELVAVLCGARAHELTVEVVVLVHA